MPLLRTIRLDCLKVNQCEGPFVFRFDPRLSQSETNTYREI